MRWVKENDMDNVDNKLFFFIQRAQEIAVMLNEIKVEEIRRILVHNYIEHVASLVSSAGAVPSVLLRCFDAEEETATFNFISLHLSGSSREKL